MLHGEAREAPHGEDEEGVANLRKIQAREELSHDQRQGVEVDRRDDSDSLRRDRDPSGPIQGRDRDERRPAEPRGDRPRGGKRVAGPGEVVEGRLVRLGHSRHLRCFSLRFSSLGPALAKRAIPTKMGPVD